MTDDESNYHVTVYAVSSKDLGKSEKDLVQEKYDLEKSMNESMEYEAECSVDQITIAGEEHPAYVEIWDNDGKTL